MDKKKPKQIIVMSSNTVAIATILILIVMFAFSWVLIKPGLGGTNLSLTSTTGNPTVMIREEPIEKNKEFGILPGEEFVYTYKVNESLFNITYSATQGSGCVMIKLLENLNNSKACIDRWGMDETGYNSTLGEPTILFFKPWMLALRENWRWNNSMYIVFDNMESKVSETYYRVMRTENYRGRLSYVVEISSDAGPVEYNWIDAEKRIMLKTVGDSYSVEITEGLLLD